MKEMILKMALPIVMNIVTEMMTPENLRKYGAKLFNLVEEFVSDTDTKIDDAVVLPLVKGARIALRIQDMGQGTDE